MTEAPQRYPLAWPGQRPRTPAAKRRAGESKMAIPGTTKQKPVSIEVACTRVEDQVERLGGVYAVLSSNLELRLDGRPRLDRGQPQDPGVCLYFQMKGKPYALACDTFNTVAQNIAALANHIEALRRIERYGVASTAETLQAFEALPAPKAPHEILGVSPGAGQQTIQAAWREKIAGAHTDRGGSHDAAAEINAARDAMLKALHQ
jgi:hypothetical protein